MTDFTCRGVLFDATGTLIETAEPVGETYRRIALAHGVDLPAWRLEDAFRRVLRNAPERGVTGRDEAARRESEVQWWRELLRQTFQAADSTARFEDFGAFVQAAFDAYRVVGAWRIRPGVEAMLTELRACGLRLGIVSNFDHRLPGILDALGLADAFMTVEIPSHLGVTKPDPAIFQSAADHLGLSLESLAYVGDDPADRLISISRLGLTVLDVHQHPAAPDWAGHLGVDVNAKLSASDPMERPPARR
jgi:putative hydrolase of the HAD superfamily